MKTQLPALLVFLFGASHWRTPLVSVALCLRPQKKPASLAGFPYLLTSNFPLALALSSRALSSPQHPFI
jgi:hypothetical protein